MAHLKKEFLTLVYEVVCLVTTFDAKQRLQFEKSRMYLIAEESTPTLVAVALPGFLARSVLTSWISDALITQWSCPPIATSRNENCSSENVSQGYDNFSVFTQYLKK